MLSIVLPVGLTLAFAFAANRLADLFIKLDLACTGEMSYVHCLRIHVLRWCACTCGLVALGLLSLPLHMLVVLALFSVSAATDLETRLLPPDLYVFGSVLLSLVLAGFTGGMPALRDAVVSQAFCFAIVTLGVAFFNICESGDIKLAMQFGAACGALPMVAVASVGIWLAALALVLVTCVVNLSRRQPGVGLQAWLRSCTALRPPQGPLLWCGLLFAHAAVMLLARGVVP